MAAISADDADDDQRSKEYSDAILQPSFVALQGLPERRHIIVISIGLQEVPKSIWGAFLSNGKGKRFYSIYLISLVCSSLGSLHYFRHLRCGCFLSYRFLVLPLSPSYF